MTIAVGPVQDGKQSVTIGNPMAGRYQTVVSTPEKIDEFVSTYDGIAKKSVKQTLVVASIPPVIGAVCGAAMKAKGVGKGIDALLGLAVGMIAGGFLSFIPLFSGAAKQDKLAKTFIAENK